MGNIHSEGALRSFVDSLVLVVSFTLHFSKVSVSNTIAAMAPVSYCNPNLLQPSEDIKLRDVQAVLSLGWKSPALWICGSLQVSNPFTSAEYFTKALEQSATS